MLEKQKNSLSLTMFFSALAAEKFGPPRRGMIADEKVVCIGAVRADIVRKGCFKSLLTQESVNEVGRVQY